MIHPGDQYHEKSEPAEMPPADKDYHRNIMNAI